ncbi:tryptophan-rich protein TspO-like [Bolinopsis microptera]|uniref:tryptophan-rich protein TspO-like n=1 Tax=Bolinopsis microptera TaxID=2820187 RepID=UPI00307968EC
MVIMDKDPVELGYKNVGKKTAMDKRDFVVFAGFLILMEGVGALMGMMTAPGGAMRPDDDWFDNLVKPSWNPPNWVFGPVWTLLYFMIALSAFKVYRKIGFSQALPWMVFFIQITLNFAWPLIFFVGHQLLGGLIDILLMLVFIILNISVFIPVEKSAGLLLLPYLAWVTFATYLNYTLWRLNPDASTSHLCYIFSDNVFLCNN